MADDTDSKPDLAASPSTHEDTETTPTAPAATATRSSPAENDSAPLDPKEERDLDAEIAATSTTPPPSSIVATQDDNSNTNPNPTMTMDVANNAPLSPTTAAQATVPQQESELAVVIEPRIPQKKDTSLREFLGKMDDYAPLIPDAVTDYYLTLAGLPPPPETDRRLARLLALATQKFIADIASDAYQYSRIRSTNTTSNNPLTGLGGAAAFGVQGGEEGAGKGKKDASKSAPLGGPRPGYGGGGASGGQGRTVLTMEDLGMAVGEYGVNVKRGEFYR